MPQMTHFEKLSFCSGGNLKVTMNRNHQNLLVTVETSLLVLLMVTLTVKCDIEVKSSQGTNIPIKTIPITSD